MKTYKVNDIRQLIDLNGESINFNINFNISSPSNCMYQLTVVSQEDIDNGDIKFKDVKGSISGELSNTNNKHQHFYLILKSNNECMLDVNIDKTELPISSSLSQTRSPPSNPSTPKTNYKKLLFIFLGIAIIIGIFIYFKKYYRNNSQVVKKIDYSSTTLPKRPTSVSSDIGSRPTSVSSDIGSRPTSVSSDIGSRPTGVSSDIGSRPTSVSSNNSYDIYHSYNKTPSTDIINELSNY